MSNNLTQSKLLGSLSIKDVVLITVSGVTPASSLFVIAPQVIQNAGSGAFYAFLLGALLAVTYGLCYAELGAAHPNAGGEYTIVQRVFGNRAGVHMYLFVLCMALFIPAVLAVGAAPYLNSALGTNFDNSIAALVIIVLCYSIGILNVKVSATVTGLFLFFEIAVLAFLAWLGLSNIHQDPSILISPVMANEQGVMVAVPFAVTIGTIGTALFCYNGFGSAIYMAEDMKEKGKPIVYAILISLAVVVMVEILPMTALILGAPSLADASKNPDTIGYVVSQLSNPTVSRVVSGGIFLSVFNAIIALVVLNGRFLYSSGRDGMWFAPLSKALTKLHSRFGTPWVATLLFAIPSSFLTFNSNLDALTEFTVILLLVVYLWMAVAALFSRRNKNIHHPYLMTFWPIPPLIAITGSAYILWSVLSTSKPMSFYIIGGIIVLGLFMIFSDGKKNAAIKGD